MKEFLKGLCKVFTKNRNILVNNYGIWFGYIASAVTIIAACIGGSNGWGWYALAGLLVLCLIFAINASWEQKKISIKYRDNFKVTVYEGNIFDVQRGVVVIPVNDYFDTLVDNKVVGETTLHGQFVKYFKSKFPERNLEHEIFESLSAYTPILNDKRGVPDHTNKYPLGAVARVAFNDRLHYYLVAATEFDWNNHPIDQPEKYSFVLQKTYKYIDENCSGLPIYLPLMGAGQMGVGLPYQELLVEMIRNMTLMRRYVTTAGTNILIYEKDMPKISLRQAKYELTHK